MTPRQLKTAILAPTGVLLISMFASMFLSVILLIPELVVLGTYVGPLVYLAIGAAQVPAGAGALEGARSGTRVGLLAGVFLAPWELLIVLPVAISILLGPLASPGSRAGPWIVVSLTWLFHTAAFVAVGLMSGLIAGATKRPIPPRSIRASYEDDSPVDPPWQRDISVAKHADPALDVRIRAGHGCLLG